MSTTTAIKPGRNDPCYCGSNKKYKRCHGAVIDIPVAPTIPGPILPDHPAWALFLNNLKNCLIKGPGYPNHEKTGLKNPYGPQPIYAGATVDALRLTGIRNDSDVLKNLFAFQQYGGVGDIEVFHNVEKRFRNGTKPAGRKIAFIEKMGLGDKVIFAGIVDKMAITFPEIKFGSVGAESLPYNSDFEVYDIHWFAAPLGFKTEKNCSYARMIHRLVQAKTGLQWNTDDVMPRIFLEGNIENPVRSKLGFDGPYWLIGGNDPHSPAKFWGNKNYCELIKRLSGKITFIQYGKTGEPLPGALNIFGQSTKQELIAAFRDCQGAIGGPGNHAHVCAAFKKPCVIIGGCVEDAFLFDYPGQIFLSGHSLNCSKKGSSLVNYYEQGGAACYRYDSALCEHWHADHGACMDSVTPAAVASAIAGAA